MTKLSKQQYRRALWGLGTMLVMLIGIAICLAVWLRGVKQQERAVATLKQLGGRVIFAHQLRGDDHSAAPAWLRALFSDEGLGRVRRLRLANSQVADRHLVDLGILSEVELLDLTGTRVTDRGVTHLGELTRLTDLNLSRTGITDAGLRQLGHLNQLSALTLQDTDVTDAGLNPLRQLTRLEAVNLSGTGVTDAGLPRLERLVSLKSLDLSSNRVTEKGIRKLQELLPKCRIVYDLLTVQVLYDDRVVDEKLQAGFGFACLIAGTERTILFDTGGKGERLLGNFEQIKTSPADVDLVVISHHHNDHTGGLGSVLEQNSHMSVYLPASSPESFVREVQSRADAVAIVTEPVEICPRVFVLGPMGETIVEQALVVDTHKGLVIVVGCAHPGIVAIARKAKEELNRNIHMICGGMHLNRSSEDVVRNVIGELKELGVEKVAPSHCSGGKAIVLFREAFGEDCSQMGVGQLLRIQATNSK